VATKKPATFELGLHQRLGRYAENKKTHLLGFINSHFANLQHQMETKVSRLDPSFPVVNCSLQT